MNWINNIKGFIAVVDHQSFSKAAEKRYTSAAGLSRRVSWLEEQLGVVLIQRTTRTLQLTEEGKQFYERGKKLLAELEELTTQLQTQQKILKGPIKVTMPNAFSEMPLVTHIIKDFIIQHPTLELILDLSNQTYDLTTAEIDIAFRMNAYSGVGYESKKLSKLTIGIFASPDYLKQHGTPKTIRELTQHNCLLHYNIGYNEWEFKNGKKQPVNGNVKSNTSRLLIEYAKSGLGIIRTLENYITEEITAGDLKPILKHEWLKPLDLYIIYKTNAPLRVKTLVDFIINNL